MTTVTIGERTGATFAGENDTNINEQSPTATNDSANVLFVYSAVAGQRRRGLMIFTGLSNISPSVTVSSVTLALRNALTSANVTLNVHRILRPWTASQACWNLRSTGNSWASNGGLNATDVDMTPIATVSVLTSTDFYSITGNSALNSLVDGWINGTIPNYGLMFVRDTDTVYDGVLTQIYGGLATVSASRPDLTVVYTAGSPPPTVSTNPDVSVVEGGSAVHTVTLSGTTTASTPFTATLAGSGANPATGGGTDFVSDLSSVTYSNGVTHSGGTLTVPSGVASFTVTIPTTANVLDNADKTYTLTVGGVASISTITDNDVPPVVTFTDGVESFGVVTCVATLGAVSGKDVSFQVDTTNGTKTAGTHYTALSAVPVTILAGNLTATITVNTL